MRDLIKKVLRESEEETAEEFIARFEKDKKRIEKTMPKIVNFLKSGFDDYNLYDISVGETKKAYGSTFYVDENGNKQGLFLSVHASYEVEEGYGDEPNDYHFSFYDVYCNCRVRIYSKRKVCTNQGN